MATAAEIIRTLAADRDALAAQTTAVSPSAGRPLWTAIDTINDEIDQLTANSLATAPYLPLTDPFKAATDEAKAFITTLNEIKTVFQDVDNVVKAAQGVLGVVRAI